jgi:uncharacterized membrane protein YfcA
VVAADAPIYAAASALAVSGLLLGNWWAGRVDQAAFNRLLVCLMLLCTALMIASAAGLGLRVHGGHAS